MGTKKTANRSVIIDGCRTPFAKASIPGSGKAPGRLADVDPTDMQALLIKELLSRTGLDPKHVRKVLTGCVHQEADQGLNIARQLALHKESGLTNATAGTSVDMFCASSLEAIALADGLIARKPDAVYIVTGVQSMSHIPMGGFNPHLAPNVHEGNVSGFMDMPITAENIAKKYGVTRAESDAFAMRSHQRAAAAQDKGHFDKEIVPLEGLEQDDGIRRDTTMDGLAKLRTIALSEKEGGIVTAGTSSQVTDGAVAVMMTSEAYAAANSLPVLGVILGTGEAGVAPEIMGIGPVDAMLEAVKEAGLTMSDIGLIELNEAFAAQSIGVLKEFNKRGIVIDENKLNVDGGAIALGHPLGASGARLSLHLLNAMKRENVRYGMAALCIGGGQGKAIVFENPDWKPEGKPEGDCERKKCAGPACNSPKCGM